MKTAEKNLATLQELLEKEKHILSDTNVIVEDVPDWYQNQVFGSFRFCELDPHGLKRVLNNLRIQENWWTQENVHTVPKVAKEIGHFKGVLKKKLKSLKGDSKIYGKRKSNRLRKPINSYLKKTSKELLQEIAITYCNLHKLARRSSIPIDYNMDALYDLVLEIGEHTDAIRDTSKRYHSHKREVDLHTDEQIVAAAFHKSLFEMEPATIVSPDGDVARLVRYTHEALIMNEDTKSVEEFLLNYPIKAYYIRRDQRAQLKYDSFQLGRKRLAEKEELIEAANDFWEAVG
jgi:hypothetical protein